MPASNPHGKADVTVSTLNVHGAQYGAVELSRSPSFGDSLASAWMTVFAVCLNTGLNAFIVINFSSVEVITQMAFAVSSDAVADLFSLCFLLIMFGIAIGLWMNDHCERASLTFSVLSNVSAAVIRWYSLRLRSYGMCMFSVLLSACGAFALLPLPSQLAHQRFPAHWRALVTNLIVQCDCLGFLLGAIVPAFCVNSVESFTTFAFWQALASIFIGFLFFAFYSPENKLNQVADDHDPSSFNGFVDIFKAFTSQPKFALSVASHGLLGGIGYAFPSAIFFILEDQQAESDSLNASQWGAACNIAFTGAGCLSGVVLGIWCQDSSRFRPVLFLCYWLCMISFACCCLLPTVNSDTTSYVLICLLGVAGATSVGFIGIAVEATCLFPGVRANYVNWVIILLVSGCGSGLQYLSAERSDMLVFVYASLLATLMFTASSLL